MSLCGPRSRCGGDHIGARGLGRGTCCWLVGNGNGHDHSPDIGVGDGLAFVAVARWIVSASATLGWLSDSDGHSLGADSRAA